jgi:hypothetical protein
MKRERERKRRDSLLPIRSYTRKNVYAASVKRRTEPITYMYNHKAND